MKRLKKNQADIIEEIKSSDQKILIAAVLKCKTIATNVWIADKLNMGVPHVVSRYTAASSSRMEKTMTIHFKS
jgi:hypothetical protein